MKSFFFVVMLTSVTAHAELFDRANNPQNFANIAGNTLIQSFDVLPLQGGLSDDRLGWSESYWPSNKGGIAYRWNHPDPQPFRYKLNTKQEVQRMSETELSQLSPAELYDISNDDFGYTLTKKTLNKFSPKDLWWEGICHGWAQAASHYPEPTPVVVTNKSGMRVPFGSSDVKALLSMHEAFNFGGKYGFVGKRCKASGKVPGEGDERDSNVNLPAPSVAESVDCRDTNAGAFHVVMANMLGIQGKGFVADIDRFGDVWNQPLTGYSVQVLGEEAISTEQMNQGIRRRVRVSMAMEYGEELMFWTQEAEAKGDLNFVSKLPVTGTVNQKNLTKNYSYIVELNANGNVIGGEWISTTRPDFLWMYERSQTFKNRPMPLANLQNIYRPVQR